MYPEPYSIYLRGSICYGSPHVREGSVPFFSGFCICISLWFKVKGSVVGL